MPIFDIRTCWCTILLLGHVVLVNGAKILGIFPLPAKSHFVYNDAMMKSLVNAGHEVTIISPFPPQYVHENYTTIDISKDCFLYINVASLNDFPKYNIYDFFVALASVDEEYCYKIMKNKQIQEILNTKYQHFDVIFLETFIMYDCFSPLVQQLNIPVIGTASQRFWTLSDQAVGNPHNPAFVPSDFSLSWNQDNFFDRVSSFWRTMFVKLVGNYIVHEKVARFVNHINENFGTFYEKRSVVPSLLFYNSHPVFFPRPLNPNVIEVGGIHVKAESPLPAKIEKFINESPAGVILFTIGSIYRASTLPLEVLAALKQAFAEIPLRIIWKLDEKVEDIPDNVLITDWIPQRDILAHKNVKAFISHCGLLGTYEAIYSGTPIVAVPFVGDQFTNSAILRDLGVAVELDLMTATKGSILGALNSIINDTRYYENMQQLSQEFKDVPLKPEESVIYWTEYIIKHKGASFLQPASAKLYWFQYFLLDVISFSIVVIAVPLYLVKLIATITYVYFKRNL